MPVASTPEPQNFMRASEHAHHHGDDDDADGDDGGILEKDQEVGLCDQGTEMLEGHPVRDPPRAGRHVRDLGVGFERGHDHVVRRRQEEDRENHQEHVGQDQRPAPAALDARESPARDRGDRGVCRRRRHPISLPRLRTPRRMNTAEMARIGNMNSDTEAPSGMSPDSMPSLNANVANMWVMLRGPPAVMIRTISKFAKVTISENSTVMAMMFCIIGSVTCRKRCHALAPSISAAS